jgi:hypothetical protein
MRKKLFLIFLSVSFASFVVLASIQVIVVSGQSRSFTQSQFIIGSGGVGSSAGGYTINSTLGQPVVGDGVTESYTLNSGFWTRISEANSEPLAERDTYSVFENQTLTVPPPGVLENDSDPDGDTLAAVKQTNPVYGALSFESDGSFVYTPDPFFTGEDDFTYKAYDGTDYSSITTVRINVVSVNQAPVAVDDWYETDEDQEFSAVYSVLENDSDADGDEMSAIKQSNPSHAASFIFNADGTFSYMPETNYCGTDSFTYKAYDGSLYSETATVDISISPINDPPTDILLSNNTIEEGQPIATLIGNLSAVDPDVGDTFTFNLVSGSGDMGNSSFTISGNQLLSNVVFDYAAQSSYSIRIEALDQDSLSTEKVFEINIVEVPEEGFFIYLPLFTH